MSCSFPPATQPWHSVLILPLVLYAFAHVLPNVWNVLSREPALPILVWIFCSFTVHLQHYLLCDANPEILKGSIGSVGWMFVFPKFICWNLSSKVMVFGSEAFGKWLDNMGGALTTGIRVLTPSTMGGVSKKTAIYEPGSGLSPDRESANTLTLGFQPPEVWEINFCYLLVTQYMVFCYRSPNRLNNMPIFLCIQNTLCVTLIPFW